MPNIMFQHFMLDRGEWWWTGMSQFRKGMTVEQAIEVAKKDMDRTRIIVVPEGEECPDFSTQVPESWVAWTYNPENLKDPA